MSDAEAMPIGPVSCLGRGRGDVALRKVAEDQYLSAEGQKDPLIPVVVFVSNDFSRREMSNIEIRRAFRRGGIDVNVIERFDLHEIGSL